MTLGNNHEMQEREITDFFLDSLFPEQLQIAEQCRTTDIDEITNKLDRATFVRSSSQRNSPEGYAQNRSFRRTVPTCCTRGKPGPKSENTGIIAPEKKRSQESNERFNRNNFMEADT